MSHITTHKQALRYVRKDGMRLQYLNTAFRRNPTIVLAAMQSNGSALRFALTRNPGIEMAAIKSNGYALEFASDEMRRDQEFVLEALKNNGDDTDVIEYAHDDLKRNREFMLRCVKYCVSTFEFAHKELERDREVVSIVLKQKDMYIRRLNNIRVFRSYKDRVCYYVYRK